MKKLFIGSNNKFKLEDFDFLIKTYDLGDIEISKPYYYGLDSPVEDKHTFEENAAIKAEYYFSKTGIPTLVDDTGICVDSLGGLPGVYTADWGNHSKDYRPVFKRVQEELKKIGKYEDFPRAKAVCVLAFLAEEMPIKFFRAEINGYLDFRNSEAKGVGFQPIFVPDFAGIPASSIPYEEWTLNSHRGNAFKILVPYLKEFIGPS